MKKQNQQIRIDQKQYKNTSLTQNWSCNKLTYDKLSLFQQELEKRQNILKFLNLNLRESQIDEEMMKNLAQVITKIEILDQLSLNLICCKVGCFQSISDILASQNRVNTLSLHLGSINMFGNEVSFISQGIFNYSSLQKLYLNLSGCTIQDKGMEILMKSISQLQNLKYLDLDVQSNKLTEKSGKYFSQRIIECKNLIFLKINIQKNDNFCSKLLINSITNLNQLKNLKQLYLQLVNGHQRVALNEYPSYRSVFGEFFNQLGKLNNIQVLKIVSWIDIYDNPNICEDFRRAILTLEQLKVLIVDQFATNLQSLFILLSDIHLHQNLNYIYVNTYYLKNSLDKVLNLKKALRLVRYQG